MKSTVSLIIAAILAGTVIVSCRNDRYVASVTELQLASVSPSTGYSGGIVKILGRNFSEVFGENRVFVGELEAQVLEYNAWDLTVVLPAQKPGLYEITVQTPKGTVSGLQFEYREKPEHEYVLSTIAGGTEGYEDGSGVNARFGHPEGLAMDNNGNLWITQRGNYGHRIRKMYPNYSVTTVLSMSDNSQFPWHCTFYAGDFYFAAKAGNKVYKVTPEGLMSEVTISGAELSNTMDVEFDNAGAMWVASRNSSTDPQGKVYKVVNGTVDKTYGVPLPTCLAIDGKGRMIIGTNSGNMYMVDGDNDPVKIAGNGSTSPSADPNGQSGDTSTASMGEISGVFAAKDGSIWFCDVKNNMVRKLTPDASGDYTKGRIETIASGFYPSDVYVTDDCTRIYVSSATSHTIRLIEVF